MLAFILKLPFCGIIVTLGLQTLHPVPSQGAGKSWGAVGMIVASHGQSGISQAGSVPQTGGSSSPTRHHTKDQPHSRSNCRQRGVTSQKVWMVLSQVTSRNLGCHCTHPWAVVVTPTSICRTRGAQVPLQRWQGPRLLPISFFLIILLRPAGFAPCLGGTIWPALPALGVMSDLGSCLCS